MKKFILPFFIIIIIIITNISFAHSGRTDSNGGHYDTSTGEYHYHHGMPAHQHPNGICPYDDNYKTTDTYDTEIETIEDYSDDSDFSLETYVYNEQYSNDNSSYNNYTTIENNNTINNPSTTKRKNITKLVISLIIVILIIIKLCKD